MKNTNCANSRSVLISHAPLELKTMIKLPAPIFVEPPFKSTIQFAVLNTASALLCAAAHNHLYFMLGLNTFTFHFMHYFFTFLVMATVVYCLKYGSSAASTDAKQPQPMDFMPLAISQAIVSIMSGVIHSGGKDGALYTIRFADCGVTIFTLVLARKVLSQQYQPNPANRNLLVNFYYKMLE